MCQKRVCVAHYSATGGTAVRESSGLKPKNKNYKILVYLLFHSCWLRVRNKSFRIRIHKTDFPSTGTILKKKFSFIRSHDFFRADNKDALALRQLVADSALTDTLEWLEREGDVAIFDATNTTRLVPVQFILYFILSYVWYR